MPPDRKGPGLGLVRMHRPGERRSIRAERNRDCQGKPETNGKGEEESYEPIVPGKVGNRENRDPLEGRGEQTNVSVEGDMTIHRCREYMSTKLSRITELAKENKERRFLSIAHYLTVEALFEAYTSLRKDASAGADGVTVAEYEENVWERLQQLHDRLKSGRYRAQPLRRVYVPKEDGRPRPISIPSLEDKIVQKAAVELLNAIYEQDFLRCSWGFRPGRSAHEALEEVWTGAMRPTNLICAGGRHMRILRCHCEKSAHGDDREAGSGWKHPTADREMDQCRSDRGRQTACHGNGDRTGAGHQPAVGKYIPSLCTGRVVSRKW